MSHPINKLSEEKAYLGDGVYADLDYGIVLTCEDGYSAYERIVLEPQVLDSLMEWLKKIKYLKGYEK